MEQDGETQATAEIIAAAESHSTSSNGFGPATTPSAMPNPALVVAAAVVGGFLLARFVRRMRG